MAALAEEKNPLIGHDDEDMVSTGCADGLRGTLLNLFRTPGNDLALKLWMEQLANEFTIYNGYHANSSDEVKVKLVVKLFENMPETIKRVFLLEKNLKKYLIDVPAELSIEDILNNPNYKKGYLSIYNIIFKKQLFDSFSKRIR